MTKKIKALSIIFLVVLASVLFALSVTTGQEVKSAYANQTTMIDIADYSELGRGINALTASKATDIKTSYSILDTAERLELQVEEIAKKKSTARKDYKASSNIMDIVVSLATIDGVVVGVPQVIGEVGYVLNNSMTVDVTQYSYKYYQTFYHDVTSFERNIVDYSDQSTYEGKYSQNFLNDLSALQNNTMNYETFFNRYGTHLVGSGTWGAKVRSYYSLLSNTIALNSDLDQVLRSYFDAGIITDGVSLTSVLSVINASLSTGYASTELTSSFYVTNEGGGLISGQDQQGFRTSYENWVNNFDHDEDSVLVDFNNGAGLVPLWEILPSQFSSLSTAMENNYISLSQDQQNSFVVNYKTANYQDFNGGSGTNEDPYMISAPQHLVNIAKYMYADYKLQTDIDISGYTQWNAIGGHYKEKAFTGTLDGDNHAIMGLTRTNDIAEQNNRAYFGLFGYLGTNATVKNLYFSYTNINFSGPAVNNGNMRFFIGVVAGYSEGATISNIRLISSTIKYECDTNGMTYAGGVVGFANRTSISGCYNSISILVKRYGAVAGGIAGYAVDSGVSNCTNSTDIKTQCKGLGGWGVSCGIVGEVLNGSTTFANCSNYGSIVAEKYGIAIGSTTQTNPISFNTNADYR